MTLFVQGTALGLDYTVASVSGDLFSCVLIPQESSGNQFLLNGLGNR